MIDQQTTERPPACADLDPHGVGYRCTRFRDHAGQHEAHTNSHVAAAWPRRDQVDPHDGIKVGDAAPNECFAAFSVACCAPVPGARRDGTPTSFTCSRQAAHAGQHIACTLVVVGVSA